MPQTATPKAARPKLLDRRLTLLKLAAMAGVDEQDCKAIAKFTHGECDSETDETTALLAAALTQALDEVRCFEDASASISLATAADEVLNGTRELADLDGFRPKDDGTGYEYRADMPCTCPPDLRARGGFSSSCAACA